MKTDIEFIKSIMPSHYEIKPSKHIGSINCVSQKGILKNIDSEDDEHWEYVVKAIKGYFGSRFMEIDHAINFGHMNFTIYLHS